MKKLLIADHLKRLYLEEISFLDRADIAVFTAATNDEILNIHKAEKVDLIITQFDMPGMRTEDLFDAMRKDKELRAVSTIIVTRDAPGYLDRCKDCGINAVFTMPVDRAQFNAKIQELLNVSPRKSYRVLLSVIVEGNARGARFLYHTENISATGALIRAEDDHLARGDMISLSFYLPDGTHIVAHGEIQRVLKQTGSFSTLYGIKFTDLDPDVKSAIKRLAGKELEHQGLKNGLK